MTAVSILASSISPAQLTSSFSRPSLLSLSLSLSLSSPPAPFPPHQLPSLWSPRQPHSRAGSSSPADQSHLPLPLHPLPALLLREKHPLNCCADSSFLLSLDSPGLNLLQRASTTPRSTTMLPSCTLPPFTLPPPPLFPSRSLAREVPTR